MVAINGASQSNKFYEMSWDGKSSQFMAKYGRVESTATVVHYNYHDWSKKYNEKLKKGYKDITHLVADEIVETKVAKEDYVAIKETKVANFIAIMKKYMDGLVSSTYSVKSDKVSIKQVAEAQACIDEIAKLAKSKLQDQTLINTKLLELYMIIPRFIKNVREAILPHIKLGPTIAQEQANLDAMASQVTMNVKAEKKAEKKEEKKESILDAIGIRMTEIKTTKEIDHLVNQISGSRVESIFQVDKSEEKKKFDDWLAKQSNKKTSIVFHGTKNTSVIPILQQGLRIRPSGNFQFSGKVYGNGNYFSEQFNVSSGYMDHQSDKVLLIYDVHVGKASTRSYSNYNDCVKAGYDSYVSDNSGRPSMRVAYNENQTCIKYIIWLKN